MEHLPNGFTGFAGLPEDFESAGEASRRSRGITSDSERIEGAAHAKDALDQPDAATDAAADLYASGQPIPFDMGKVDAIADRDQRWAWTEIDLSAIRHNVGQARRFMQPRCRLMAVVKADGYGHGAVEVARAALSAGAERLGVATVPEGVELRRAGITAPIQVLSQPPASSIPVLLAYSLTPALYEPEFAIAYGEMADVHNMRAPFHLAVNTGMNRIGVRFDEVREFLFQIGFHRALELEGIFTHYATADSSETLDFQIQTKRFVEMISGLQASGVDTGIVHAANSAALYRFPDVHFDMVRVGCALYGFYPCPETRDSVELRPAMSVHARIVDTRMPAMSEGVSYGLHYRSPGSVKICTLPLGFADGLRVGLSGNTYFVMGGRYYHQVGEICMDQCMFEVDMRSSARRERVDPQVGDEVLVVGSQGIAEASIDEMAEKLRCDSREIALGFAQRLKRVYV